MTKDKKNIKSFSLYTLVLALILSVTIFLYLLDNFKSYKSELSVIFVAKNENVAILTNQILSNLSEISKRLSFCERVVSRNPDLKDPYEEYSPDEKKKMWNDNFNVSRIGDGSILKLEFYNPNRNISEGITRQAALVLAETASQYYNIQTEADMRIIDGTETKAVIKNQYWLTLVSLTLGTILALLLAYIFTSLFQKGKPNSYSPTLAFEKNIITPTPSPFLNQFEQKKEQVIAPRYEHKLSFPPSNLPVIEEDEYMQSLVETVPEEGKSEIIENAPIPAENGGFEKASDFSQEPSDEEYRRRLNALLRGE